jgi:uncharacterized protein YajQ (UPF0234 family)
MVCVSAYIGSIRTTGIVIFLVVFMAYCDKFKRSDKYSVSKEGVWQMPSFDVVSRTDLMEVDNAINGMKREIKQRFDLAGSKCDVERNENSLVMIADDNMKLKQLHDLLRKYLAQRKVDNKAFEFAEARTASGDTLRQNVDIKQGIESELGKKITKAVKGTKMKVQVSMKGEELHVSGKKRDDLQEIIAFIKDMENKQPLQYVNFRD